MAKECEGRVTEPFRMPESLTQLGGIPGVQDGLPAFSEEFVVRADDVAALVRSEVERALRKWPGVLSEADKAYLDARFGFPAPETPQDTQCLAFNEGGRCYKDDGHLGTHNLPTVPTSPEPCGAEVDGGDMGQPRYFVCALPKGHPGKHTPWQDCPVPILKPETVVPCTACACPRHQAMEEFVLALAKAIACGHVDVHGHKVFFANTAFHAARRVVEGG